ncbi:MAG: electron transport complex subunit RsxC [Candidatus Omnitrophica bacterium]|nr:electron transport complex subunit RsxC [Candidatus Omnitrophota bacterium]
MSLSFSGGKHIPGYKHLTQDLPVVTMAAPAEVIIPLSQHTGAVCKTLLKKGDKVKVGTKIGSSDKLISSTVHSSVSGEIKAIADYNHPVLGTSIAVIITSDGKDELDASIKLRGSVSPLGKEELLKIVKESGIVGLGGAAFPTHVKLTPPKSIDTLLINAAECEPYLTCDYRIMIENPNEILKGINLLKKILGVKNIVVGIEDDKLEAISVLRNKIIAKSYSIKVQPLKTKYPQGAEKQLIKAILDREVPAGKLPFEAGVVVINVGTALALYEAVYLGKPLYERIVTVTGKSLRSPANLKVRIGTKFSDLIEFCHGTSTAASKVIMGGPMMGLAQFSTDTPVIKGTSGVLVLSEKEAPDYKEGPCIRCGRCVDICPVGMLPFALSMCAESKMLEQAAQYNPRDCIECGICTYICPARRRILESIRLIKAVAK